MRDLEFKDAEPLAGMTPYACSYTKDGVWYAITLYGTSEEQILEDNCDLLDNLRIDGILVAVADANPRET